MEEFVESNRRIRPELQEEIWRLYMRDFFGFEGDPKKAVEKDEDHGKAIAKEFGRTHPGLTPEKAIWALEQQMQLWEDTAIRTGKCLYAIKTHETHGRYLKSMKQIGEGKMSEELADAYILAYKEERQNG